MAPGLRLAPDWLEGKAQLSSATISNSERKSIGFMNTSPLAGKLAEASILVNVPRLITAYYTEVIL